MEKIKNLVVKIALVLTFLVLAACSNDEESKIEVAYDFQVLEIVFQSVGESLPPMVAWDGEVGTFALKEPVTGVSIATDTGVLTWEKALALGENPIVVVAQNSRTRTEVSLTIESTLAGTYWVGWDEPGFSDDTPMIVSLDKQFEFNNDGSITLRNIGVEDPAGVGVWSNNENVIELRFSTGCPLPDPFIVPEIDEHILYIGTLSNNSDEGATIRGEWYRVDFNPEFLETVIGEFGMFISNEFFDF
ncbi:MAG: hypothetical protein AAF634_03330 [Bacteroidota bacterium]